jgi:hypothetical protein
MKKIIALMLLGFLLTLGVVSQEGPKVSAPTNVPLGREPASSSSAAPADWQEGDDQEGDIVTAQPLREQPLGEDEKESIGKILQILAAKEKLGKSPQELFSALGEAGLQPRAALDSNPYTGSLLMVRTNNALPGTRYFHAQVFQEEGSPGHMQHASFEIRPSPDGMKTALSLLKATHPHLGVPRIHRDDYVLWKTNGRVVSVKRIGADELDNHFNAHAPDDVGTVWVVSEDEPEHGEGT